ncbi:hypothetical protein HHK36_000484 [Tetracentron sinense]|uniref:Uncharacterized protein n=1 Tax=Tetracentron sinense TaxID=13715 RepID=A0A835DQT4_TETSI|nr:hypothetical protein HHK36_000484 [Tetracentron sinense]
MATSLQSIPFLFSSKYHLSTHQRAVSKRHVATIKAFRRSDFDGFTKRVASGEAWRDVWRSANDGFEQLLFEAKKTAERLDRQYSVSRRLTSVVRSGTDRVRELDREFEIGRRWRSFTLDFSRDWPRVCILSNILGFLQLF